MGRFHAPATIDEWYWVVNTRSIMAWGDDTNDNLPSASSSPPTTAVASVSEDTSNKTTFWATTTTFGATSNSSNSNAQNVTVEGIVPRAFRPWPDDEPDRVSKRFYSTHLPRQRARMSALFLSV